MTAEYYFCINPVVHL